VRSCIFAALFLSGLSGCAAVGSPYGNFLREPSIAHERTIADDAVKQLVALYPPAMTRFDLRQETPDAFGTVLLASLRANGYAVSEFKAAPSEPKTSGFSLRYVLDQPDDLRLYRLTLWIDDKPLSRVYLAQDGSARPAGVWVRKE
jgi:hypothetical protein